MAGADDSEIWERAIKTNSAIFTKDEDFSVRRKLNDSGPSIVWIRVGNTGNRKLLDWIDLLWSEIEAALSQNESLIEII
ncbi:MAG: DUF5615 family PIN-like protein [Spirochaetia bacterium]|nr:DUF5615 family PIN-like protein [Spirochaetia bacterium]